MALADALQNFDPEYLQRLKDKLLPRLQKSPGWIEVEVLTDDPELFINALIALMRNGYFEDYQGNQRVEIGIGDRRVRYIPDYEIDMINKLKNEKSDTIHRK